MSYDERIALDSKVGVQGLVGSLAGDEALPIHAEVQAWPNSSVSTHRPIALICTAHDSIEELGGQCDGC